MSAAATAAIRGDGQQQPSREGEHPGPELPGAEAVPLAAAPEPVPETPGGTGSAPAEEAVLPRGPAVPEPADLTAVPAAPATTSPAAAAVTGDRARQAEGLRLAVAGALAIAAAGLLVLGMFPSYMGSIVLIDYRPTQWSVLIHAALVAGAGAAVLVPRTRPVVGPAILTGVAVGSIWGLLTDLVNAQSPVGDVGPGLWLQLLADTVLLLAGFLAGLALVQGAHVRIVLWPLDGPLRWLVALLGVAGSVAFFAFVAQSLDSDLGRRFLVVGIWAGATTLLVPAAAAVIVPRHVAAAFLGGWAAATATNVVLDLLTYSDVVSAAIPALVVSACALLGLLVLVVPLARAGTAPQAEPATR